MPAEIYRDLYEHMLLLDDDEFHIALDATKIRTPDVIAGSYLVLTNSDLRSPIKPGKATDMVLSGNEVVVNYWHNHRELAKQLQVDLSVITIARKFDSQAKLYLRNDISRACIAIQNKFLDLLDVLGIRYSGISLSEDEWRVLELSRSAQKEKLRALLKSGK